MAPSIARYTATAKSLHWIIVLLLVVQFVIGWIMPHIGRNTQPDTLINTHFSVGMLALLVALARLGWRLAHGEPEPLDGIPSWQVASARVVHRLLYALLFVVPLLGWINASWRGFAVVMFGIEFPKLIATRAPGWAWTGDVHGILANYVMLGLVGLHVAAVVYHQFVRRDRVLDRMLPGG